MSRNWAVGIHLALIILGAGNQYLLPAFSQLNPMQLVAVATFLSVVFQAVQMVLGIQAYALTPSGDKAGQSTVATVYNPQGEVAGVVETHKEPTK